MGYSLCKMADFENLLISRILGVFRPVFPQNNSNLFVEWCFAFFFGIFNFWPKLTILQGYTLSMDYKLCKMADFQDLLISRILGVFRSFFPQNNSDLFVEWLSHVLGIFNFWPKQTILQGYSLWMGYSLCKMADFENLLISRILGVFRPVFL